MIHFDAHYFKHCGGIVFDGRFGGEEFAVLLPNTHAAEAAEIANQLKNHIITSTIALMDNNAVSLTASFGVSDFGETLEELLNHADKAMYQAKNNGRNHVMSYCAQTMNTQALT